MAVNSFREPGYFISRELSWLEFNQRVLDEARDPKNPLMERAKFLAITLSNLDEFFMVRVAGIKDQIQAEYDKPDPAGLTPKQQKKRIGERAHIMMEEVYNIYNRILLPQLKKEGFYLVGTEDLTAEDHEYLQELFETELYPVLTPMAVDPSRPFPLILNKSLNIALFVEDPDGEEPHFATVQVPGVLPRLVGLPEGSHILLEDVLKLFLEQLFPNQKILSSACYRITRSGDLNFQEEEAHDLLKEIEKSLKQRKRGQAVRLEMGKDADEALVRYLMKALEIRERDLFLHDGPMDVSFISKVGKILPLGHLQKEDIVPQTPVDLLGVTDLFAAIREHDILMHHPYETFQPVVSFMQQAAEDPNVLAIKQTLYRVSGNSPIVHALEKAAENGKQVTVLVEVKARFDEENNIQWAKKLEQAGCHVIYGLVGLKTHCKVTIVVRRDEDRIRRYVHMSTGNYNDVTARLYTDIGYFTAKEPFGADASALFNSLTGYGDPPAFRKVAAAPLGLRKKFNALIEREMEHAKAGREARIIAKMNSLLDPGIIEKLYEASSAGVKIDLIVRGICALRPGIPGVSENIRVRSIVGWLLEHSRIFYFYNDGHEEYYLASADWMSRNLDRRVELLFPIEDERLMQRIGDMLQVFLSDTQKAKVMDRDGNYVKVDGRGKPVLNCQEFFYGEAKAAVANYDDGKKQKVFQPLSAPEEDEYKKQEE
jgi:polyphosphate kinase